MTCNPHPTVMIAVAEQRHAELRDEADRFRLAKLGQDDIDRRQPWSDLLAVAAVALPLLLAASAAAAQDKSSQTQHELEQAAQELAEDDAATIAVQKVREAAS